MTVLVGTRTRLRAWRADDAAAIHDACQDPEIQRFTTVPSPYRRADADCEARCAASTQDQARGQ